LGQWPSWENPWQGNVSVIYLVVLIWTNTGKKRQGISFALALITFANMLGEYNDVVNEVPSFIITDIPALPAMRPPPSQFPDLQVQVYPSSPGNAYGAPSPTTSDLDASLIPPSMVLSPHSGTHFQTTIQVQLHDNNLAQNSLGLTTHAPLNCNMPGQNHRVSNP